MCSMPFTIQHGHKFACVALSNAGVDRVLREEVRLGGDVWAVFGPPFRLDDHWREWMGTVQLEHLERASLTIIATAPSNALDVLDAENESLRQRVLGMFYALHLVEIFHYDGGLTITGANTNGSVSVRQVSILEHYFRPPGVLPIRIDIRWLEDAYAIANGMQVVHRAGVDHHQRLRRGFRAWIGAMQEYNGDDRVHQFVRAVEATVKPEAGRSRAQFVHRGQLFAGNSLPMRERLGELYDLRGGAEHMNPLDSSLLNYPEAQREVIGLQRSFQAQILASTVYRRILSNPELHATFTSDEHIARFWAEPWATQVAEWGDSIDLDAVADRRFRNELAR
jgi:hypothetical protein